MRDEGKLYQTCAWYHGTGLAAGPATVSVTEISHSPLVSVNITICLANPIPSSIIQTPPCSVPTQHPLSSVTSEPCSSLAPESN